MSRGYFFKNQHKIEFDKKHKYTIKTYMHPSG